MTDAITSRRRRIRRIAILVVLAVLVAAWGVYKVTATRFPPSVMVADTSCLDDPTTVAELSGLDPDADSIECEPWDIGTGVTGYTWTAPRARGIVLFQHGWGDYAQRWVQQADEFIPKLLDAGYSVYAFDMWGSGRSPGQRGVTDVGQAVEDHLAARAAIPESDLPVFLVGHSLGGLVTVTSALDDPYEVAGVILLAPALQYEVSGFERVAVNVAAFFAPTLPAPLDPGTIDDLTSDPAAQVRLENDPILHTGTVPWVTAAGGANVSADNLGRYPGLMVPILAAHGSEDVSTAGSRELIDAVGSDDKEYVAVAGAHHLLLDDVGADETIQTILNWLDARA